MAQSSALKESSAARQGLKGFENEGVRVRSEVEGAEPDPEAARIAREQRGLNVRVGTLEPSNLAPESYDAITMSHVIEHGHDPVATLKRCHESLRPGGSLIVVTPNVSSLGHRHFRRCYFHLDPPRRLFLLASQRWEPGTTFWIWRKIGTSAYGSE